MATQIQNHIHLDTSIGGAPENAPTQTWSVFERAVIPVKVSGYVRGITGQLRNNVLMSSGEIVQLRDYGYVVKVQAEGVYTAQEMLETLLSMDGKTVYLVDNYHPDDGEDHTSDVRTMRMTTTGVPEAINAAQQYYTVQVELTDNSL